MTNTDITRQRLYTQGLATSRFERPGDVVAWLGAVQAQDYLGALWAVGQRMRHAVEADIERAIAERTIVRTWPMRGTLHFVAPADVRWMLALLTPRIVAGSAGRLKGFGIDAAVLHHSSEVLVDALGGKQLTRNELYTVLEGAGIATAGGRGLHILGVLAQQGLICFGPRQGRQHTFVLLDEWVPSSKVLERDEALAEVARRYFTSHGPATLHDFVWWTGLTVGDARAAIELAKPQLAQEVIDGKEYWLAPSSAPDTYAETPSAHLLPAYDEYTVAYSDRSAFLDPQYADQAKYGIFSSVITLDGQLVGTWTRSLAKDRVTVALSPFMQLDEATNHAVAQAAQRYGTFLGVEAAIA